MNNSYRQCWLVTGMKRAVIVSLFPLCLFTPQLFGATVYRWVDEHGKVHFSDEAMPETNKQAVGQLQEVEITGPPRQSDAARDLSQQQENSRWFQRRTQEREKQERERRKQQAKRNKALGKKRETCNKARYKLEDAERELKARKRAGIKIHTEAKLNTRIENYRADVDRKC
tara:strand:+ start:591 stop:1103 length:513 start_codon:yes stop_codon:yes gene_type:complete